MQIVIAAPGDIPAWRELAREVEPLFGPMLADPAFEQALVRNIERGTALCVRVDDGPPGAPLAGAIMYSATHAPLYRIGWLAVAAVWRRRGVGRTLVEQALSLAPPDAVWEVVTFDADRAAGAAARSLYMRCGFRPAEAAPPGPDGSPRQVFRRP